MEGQHQQRDCQRLAWTHLRFATSMASLGAPWSTQFGKCFYNNVFIDNLVGDIEIGNYNLRLSMSLNKRDAPTHRQHQWWAPKTSEQQGVHHTTVFGRILRQQPTEEIIGIHIDIDIHRSHRHRHPRAGQQHGVQRVLWQRFLDGKLNLQQGLVCDQLRAQHLHHEYNSFVGDQLHRLTTMVNDVDLMLNTTILLHHWHLTTSSFKFRGCNIRNGH